MVKLGLLFSKLLFLDIHSKDSTIIFWCMVIPLGPQLVYTSEGPKTFVN